MLAQIEQRLPLYEQHRVQRETRQRALGGGRNFGLSLTIHVALVLSYLRLHVPQTVVAVLYGCKQWDVSRELRRLLPLVEQVLPCPEVWQSVTNEEGVPAELCLELEQSSRGARID